MLARHETFRFAGVAAAALAVCAAIGPMAGCRGQRSDKPPRQFLPDMDDSPKWKPQSASEFFADGRTMRKPVEGTVAFGLESAPAHVFGEMPADFARRADQLKEDRGFYFGRDETGEFLTTMPASVKVDRDLLLRGQERFNIYCSVCHGYQGEGGYEDGTRAVDSSAPVGKRWSIPVPTYHDPKYRDPALRTGKDGYIFDVARYGLWDDQLNHSGNHRMPAYGHALDAHDTWAVVAYIRVLQAAWADPASVPAELRPDESTRPAPVEGAAPAVPAATAPAEAGSSDGENIQ